MASSSKVGDTTRPGGPGGLVPGGSGAPFLQNGQPGLPMQGGKPGNGAPQQGSKPGNGAPQQGSKPGAMPGPTAPGGGPIAGPVNNSPTMYGPAISAMPAGTVGGPANPYTGVVPGAIHPNYLAMQREAMGNFQPQTPGHSAEALKALAGLSRGSIPAATTPQQQGPGRPSGPGNTGTPGSGSGVNSPNSGSGTGTGGIGGGGGLGGNQNGYPISGNPQYNDYIGGGPITNSPQAGNEQLLWIAENAPWLGRALGIGTGLPAGGMAGKAFQDYVFDNYYFQNDAPWQPSDMEEAIAAWQNMSPARPANPINFPGAGAGSIPGSGRGFGWQTVYQRPPVPIGEGEETPPPKKRST